MADAHKVGQEQVNGTGVGAPMRPPPGQKAGEVLHQRSKLPFSPMKMAMGGFAFVAILGYLTLYSKKKPEATALDVAKVTTGIASPDNTHPRK